MANETVKVTTNQCADGDKFTVRGKLGFCYYLTRPKMGEALAKDIQGQKARGVKFVDESPRFEATLEDAEIVVTGTAPTMAEKYGHQRLYTNKDGVSCYTVKSKIGNLEKIRLPLFKLKSTGEKLSLANKSLAAGQTVECEFEIKSTSKGNNACCLRSVPFESEPEFFVSDFECGDLYSADSATPTQQAQAPAQPEQAPAEQTPVGDGFVPTQESFWS